MMFSFTPMGFLGLFFLAVPAAAEDVAPLRAARPNILWLIAEDLGVELGCYGTREVWTPALDRLASGGVRYTRAYTTAPVCSPSRSAFMTGMYQTTIGARPTVRAKARHRGCPTAPIGTTDTGWPRASAS